MFLTSCCRKVYIQVIFFIVISWWNQQQHQCFNLFHNNHNNNNNNLFVYGQDFYSYPYIYPTQDEPINSSYPVQDYIQLNTNYRMIKNDKPSFLFSPEPNIYRIVEYYVHWCGRCRAFKSHFIVISKRIVEIAAKQNKTIEVHAMSCTPNKPLCMEQGIKGYPVIKIYQPGETIGYIVPFQSFSPHNILDKFHIDVNENEMDEWDIDGAILDAEKDLNHIIPTSHSQLENSNSIISYLFGNEYMNDPYNDPNGIIQQRIINIRHHRRTRNELKNDIHLSLDFILRNGVYMDDNPLAQERREAIHSFIHLLNLILPSTWTHTRKLLSEILTDFNFAARTELYLLGILDDHTLNNITEWSLTCNHGDSSLGFTCGVWELLHVITVTTIQYNIIAEKPLGTEMVARYIKDFIEYFFPCDYCRDHFVKIFNNCDYHRCTRLDVWTSDAFHGHQHHIDPHDPPENNELANMYNISHGMELALWLFEVHNGINIRLLKEKVDNHNEHIRNKQQHLIPTLNDYKNVLYPSYKECYKCWKHYYNNNTLSNEQQPGYHNDTVLFENVDYLITNYNRNEVIHYLLLEYGSERDDELNQFQLDMNEHYKIISNDEDERYLHELNIQHNNIHYKMIFKLFSIIVSGLICLILLLYIMKKVYQQKRNTPSYNRKKIT